MHPGSRPLTDINERWQHSVNDKPPGAARWAVLSGCTGERSCGASGEEAAAGLLGVDAESHSPKPLARFSKSGLVALAATGAFLANDGVGAAFLPMPFGF